VRHPSQTWLVIAAGQAQATFDEHADAVAYANDLHAGDDPIVLCLPHWPAGLWRYGIETPTAPTNSTPITSADRADYPDRVSPVVQAAHRHHMRVNHRCHGAGITTLSRPHHTPRYRCGRCGDRIL
jgi:hypothetical protein